jgi:hypothetical protein
VARLGTRSVLAIAVTATVAVIAAVFFLLLWEPPGGGLVLPEPYEAYIPPRSDMGPGTVFEGEIVDNRIRVTRLICRNLYAGQEPPIKPVTIALPQKWKESELTIGAAAKLLNTALEPTDKGTTGGVNASQITHITWGDTVEYSYYAEDSFLENGTPRPINQQCRSAIDAVASPDIPQNRFFIVIRTLAATGLRYEIESKLAATIGLDQSAGESLDVQTDGNVKVVEKNVLEINQPLHIGHTPFWRLTEWVPTGQVSGLIVSVKGEPIGLALEDSL